MNHLGTVAFGLSVVGLILALLGWPRVRAGKVTNVLILAGLVLSTLSSAVTLSPRAETLTSLAGVLLIVYAVFFHPKTA